MSEYLGFKFRSRVWRTTGGLSDVFTEEMLRCVYRWCIECDYRFGLYYEGMRGRQRGL